MRVDEIFHRFMEKAPLKVMMRALFERGFHPERLEAWFAQTADAQYTYELSLSTMFRLMSEVVYGVRRSIHEAYQASEEIGWRWTARWRGWRGSLRPSWCAIRQ